MNKVNVEVSEDGVSEHRDVQTQVEWSEHRDLRI